MTFKNLKYKFHLLDVKARKLLCAECKQGFDVLPRLLRQSIGFVSLMVGSMAVPSLDVFGRRQLAVVCCVFMAVVDLL